ncbi:acetylxylan esterase [bacterium]|nr:acetylxylan esterase [bacterium]
MRFTLSIFFALTIALGITLAQTPTVLPENTVADDVRLIPKKTLNGHFPFKVPGNPAQWYERSEQLRRRVLVSTGLWPMPEKPPLEAVVFDKTQRKGFTVEKVYFQSLPGHYVTGLLFRPDSPSNGPRPAVLSPHGHGGRMQEYSDAEVAQQIAQGAEHFAKSGKRPKLARCAQLARMGCVCFIFDMLGYADSQQISREVAHRHANVRPEERKNSDGEWVFYSPQADLRLQSIMGLQTWNAIRALDFLAALPDVDPERLAVTGGSGGGTQSILLGAIDDRIKVSFPNGMVSTSMQGGCYCENCNLLRIDTGNVELAALFAPRPQAMTAADDWTRDMMKDGYPQLSWLYAMIGNESDVYCRPMLHFKHNYNYVTRATMYQWMNRHLKLGLDDPVIEQDYEPLTTAETTIWGGEHPTPTDVGIEHEKSVCKWFTDQATAKLVKLNSADEKSRQEFNRIYAGAWQVIFDQGIPQDITFDNHGQETTNGIQVRKFLVHDKTRQAKVPLLVLHKVGSKPKTTVIWTTGAGKESLFTKDGQPDAKLQQLLDEDVFIVLPDLLDQGELQTAVETTEESEQRIVDDKRSYSAFTFGYNRTLVAERCADLLATVAFSKTLATESINLLSTDGSSTWAAPTSAIAGSAITRAAIDTNGFRFSQVARYQDMNFVPGAVKYGDLPMLLALRAPNPLTIVGEKSIPSTITKAYESTADSALIHHTGELDSSLLQWLSNP